MSSSCTPSKQISAAALKGNQVLGQLLRTFIYRDQYTFIKLYKQYVRPHLEFSVQAWSPWFQQDIELLENVQRRAVKAVSGLSGSYQEKLESLILLSPAERRHRGDMIETFKLLHNIEDVDASKFFTISSNIHDHATRQSTTITDDVAVPTYGLVKGPCKLELRANWNCEQTSSPSV